MKYPMLYTQEFGKKDFQGKTTKDAYLKANKWYAQNVLSKDELRNVQVRYEKVHDAQLPTVTVHLYASLTEAEVRNNHCNICKEMHNTFFMSSVVHCEECNLLAYQKRLDSNMDNKTSFCRMTLRRGEEEYEQ